MSMTRDVSDPGASDAPYRSWIDAPADGRLPSACGVIVGWCFRRDGRPVPAVRAKAGDRLFPGRYGHARPDVSAFFDDAAGSGNCGFDIPVLVFTTTTCQIEAQAADGLWEPIQTCVVIPASSMCG